MLAVVPKGGQFRGQQINFGVTKYMVNKSQALKNEQGIVTEPVESLGKTMFEETMRTVKPFCEDKFFRMCPGKTERMC